MNDRQFPHLHIPSDRNPKRGTDVNLIPEDLARAHMRARIEEAERYRIARSARAHRWLRHVDARLRTRRRLYHRVGKH